MTLKHNYPNKGLRVICGLFGKSRQAHYSSKWREHETKLEHAIVLELVSEIRVNLPRIGTPKLHFMLTENFRKHNIKMGRAALNDLLSAHGMLVRNKKRKPKTTDSNHWYRRYSNLILGWQITEPNQVWVSDITYITIKDRFAYLSLITDAYSRKILGYCLCQTLESIGPIMALKMALQTLHKNEMRPIHHSDRGVQYCCYDYTTLLNDRGLSISMTQKGDPYENAIAERVNGILKSEFNVGVVFGNIEQATSVVDQSIVSYNQLRPHASCNYLTPEQAHLVKGELKRRWKNYRRKRDPEWNETLERTATPSI
jgi:transposase InsO family protein